MRRFLLAVTILSLAAAIWTAAAWSQTPAAPSPSPAPPSSAAQTVTGEVLMLTPELCIVRDPSGKSTLLTVGKDTAGTGNVKVGDKVEAQMTADGRALSIKPLR